MPTITDPQNDPQQPTSPPPQTGTANPFLEYMRSQGYAVQEGQAPAPDSPNPFMAVLAAQVAKQRDARMHPFKTLLSDLGTTIQNTLTDVVATMNPAFAKAVQHQQEMKQFAVTENLVSQKINTPGSMIDMVEAANDSGPYQGKGLLSLVATQAGRGFAHAPDLLDKLPFVGETVQATMAPIQAQVDATAAQNLHANLEAYAGPRGTDPLHRHARDPGQHCRRSYCAGPMFKPFMFAGNLLLNAAEWARLLAGVRGWRR
jgi:hypothetical protein